MAFEVDEEKDSSYASSHPAAMSSCNERNLLLSLSRSDMGMATEEAVFVC